jgi:hypothetical protein
MSWALRTPRRWIVLALLACSIACAEPPTKELDQAQGAIETARAAGADVFAAEEFKAAQSALQRAHAAVEERDYRQALSLALDAKERAREAARLGAVHMAELRSSAERTLDEALRLLKIADVRLSAADGTRLSAEQRAALRARLDSVTTILQEARAAMAKQGYQQARAGGEAALQRVREVMTTLSDAPPRGGRRPARKPEA